MLLNLFSLIISIIVLGVLSYILYRNAYLIIPLKKKEEEKKDSETITVEENNNIINTVSTNVTYNELKTMVEKRKLLPFAFYCITDYETTAIGINVSCKKNYIYNIVVQALSEKTLSEDAYAIVRNTTLNVSFKIKYSIYNDSKRFGWADEINGKGVIYELTDTNNNTCPYDFKNILIDDRYTFGITQEIYNPVTDMNTPTTQYVPYDYSNKVYNCTILPLFNKNGIQEINFNRIHIANINETMSPYNVKCNVNSVKFESNSKHNLIVGNQIFNVRFGCGCEYNVLKGQVSSGNFSDYIYTPIAIRNVNVNEGVNRNSIILSDYPYLNGKFEVTVDEDNHLKIRLK